MSALHVTRNALVAFARFLVGARAHWAGCPECPANPVQRVYFSNHTSHLDSLTLWAALPTALRTQTRPVAAKDYWGKGGVKTFVADRGLRAVYIDRSGTQTPEEVMAPLRAALDDGDSLIIFPEGTRGQARMPGAFRPGLYHLAKDYPHVEFVPVYLDNLHRAMPKGCLIPLPLNATAHFGAVMGPAGDDRDAYLEEARKRVMTLAGEERWG